MVNAQEPEETHEVEAAAPISPKITGQRPGKEQSDDKCERKVPSMLPLNDVVPVQVANVGIARFNARLHEHPAYVRPKQAVMCAIWI